MLQNNSLGAIFEPSTIFTLCQSTKTLKGPKLSKVMSLPVESSAELEKSGGLVNIHTSSRATGSPFCRAEQSFVICCDWILKTSNFWAPKICCFKFQLHSDSESSSYLSNYLFRVSLFSSSPMYKLCEDFFVKISTKGEKETDENTVLCFLPKDIVVCAYIKILRPFSPSTAKALLKSKDVPKAADNELIMPIGLSYMRFTPNNDAPTKTSVQNSISSSVFLVDTSKDSMSRNLNALRYFLDSNQL